MGHNPTQNNHQNQYLFTQIKRNCTLIMIYTASGSSIKTWKCSSFRSLRWVENSKYHIYGFWHTTTWTLWSNLRSVHKKNKCGQTRNYWDYNLKSWLLHGTSHRPRVLFHKNFFLQVLLNWITKQCLFFVQIYGYYRQKEIGEERNHDCKECTKERNPSSGLFILWEILVIIFGIGWAGLRVGFIGDLISEVW